MTLFSSLRHDVEIAWKSFSFIQYPFPREKEKHFLKSKKVGIEGKDQIFYEIIKNVLELIKERTKLVALSFTAVENSLHCFLN